MSSINAKPSAPKKYSGTRDMVELDNWVFAVRQYLHLVTIEEDKKVILLSTFLIGEALLWFRTSTRALDLMNPTQITWIEVLSQLQAYFTPPNMHDTLMDKWVNIRQTSSVSRYVAELRSIQLQLPELTQLQILDKFIRGLRQRTKIEIKLRAPASVEEAITLADRFDRIVYRQDTYRSSVMTDPYQSQDNFDADAMQIDAVQVRRNQGQRPPVRQQLGHNNRKPQDLANVTCYNCNQKGHYANKCSMPRKPSLRFQGKGMAQ